MSGNKLIVDTNIILYLLEGDEHIAQILEDKEVYVSFITELELLGFVQMSSLHEQAIREFLSFVIIIDINNTIKEAVIHLKQQKKIKLPDAIIAATALYLNLPLLSADKGFQGLEDLQFLQYSLD